MAPTSLDVEAHALVVPARKETAETGSRLSGGPVVQDSPGRHRKLLKYLNRVVAKTCPTYLQNDRDDIAQTVLMRLSNKLDEIEEHLERCCRLLHDSGGRRKSEVAKILRLCLKEIGKSWHRGRSERIKSKLATCARWAEENDGQLKPKEVRGLLKESLAWLAKKGGRELFADVYIKRGVHWAILDARKKLFGMAEVSLEEGEEGFLERGPSPRGMSWQRSLMIREEISDCLTRLDEPKRFPTFLALLGYEYSEIAQYFDLSIPQADSRIRRGKAFLRNCLKLKGVFP